MNIAAIETNVQQLIQNLNHDSFIYDLLLAYGQPKASITRLQQGGLNLSKIAGEILWKKKLYYKSVPTEDIHALAQQLKKAEHLIKNEPRFIVLTDFVTLFAIDCKTSDTLDVPILDLPKHFDFFLPWAGMEKAQYQTENPADVKAAEKMARLYDEIKKDNPIHTPAEAHNLNVFLSRLLFCFFAEDTGIFKKSQFTQALSSHTQVDGSDLQDYLDKLFVVMNTEPSKRIDLPDYLSAFPYVNGGLYKNPHQAPLFSRRSRQIVLDCGELDWSAINPDIFGSMIQAVVTPEHRGSLGMHYTSVPNIMKVIEPLFLNELKEEFEAAKGNSRKLNNLLQRIWNIKIFDPACGSGNFLIIAYKELRKLEMKIYQELDALKGNLGSGLIDFGDNSFSKITLANFFGIELDDFAHEVATLSLWLAEHQMNQAFFAAFGRTKPALPLKETGNIVHGNATRLDWELVCPKKEGDEVYVLGNPPYLGSSMQSSVQKEDMALVFKGNENYKKQDYISCWFFKAALYINENSCFSFVTTNSVCQGTQVEMTWPHIFRLNLEIFFAHKDFKWENSAKGNAAVICSIIGVRHISNKSKYLYIDSIRRKVDKINAYLINSSNTIVTKRNHPLSQLPKMTSGNKPLDGGNLVLTEEEKDLIVEDDSNSNKFIKKFIGSYEYINGFVRWCLWIPDNLLAEALSISKIKERIEKVKTFRETGGNNAKNKVNSAHRFEFTNEAKKSQIIVPRVSSIRRQYIPTGFVEIDQVIADSAQVIFDAEPFVFSLINSKMHMVWVHVTAGRLKSDFRYSSFFSYNTFPFPPISATQKQELEKHVYQILEEREQHSEKTLAQLYDPDKMPEGLREAHRQNDLAVERCYRSRPFDNDEERLEYLFKLYEQMIAAEQANGTLFAGVAKSKKQK
jgi:hypothetical protein